MKVKVSTVAYKAEKEIESEIYNDTGLYKISNLQIQLLLL